MEALKLRMPSPRPLPSAENLLGAEDQKNDRYDQYQVQRLKKTFTHNSSKGLLAMAANAGGPDRTPCEKSRPCQPRSQRKCSRAILHDESGISGCSPSDSRQVYL